jgi:hypothetical protein
MKLLSYGNTSSVVEVYRSLVQLVRNYGADFFQQSCERRNKFKAESLDISCIARIVLKFFFSNSRHVKRRASVKKKHWKQETLKMKNVKKKKKKKKTRDEIEISKRRAVPMVRELGVYIHMQNQLTAWGRTCLRR